MYISKSTHEWKYEVGDRTLESSLFAHYRAIIQRRLFYRCYDAWGQPFYSEQEPVFGGQGDPFYLTFDTNLTRGYPAYTWVDAVEFEKQSSLDFRPPLELVPSVLAKAQLCVDQQVPYSVLQQTDCDSITRRLYTNERWNKQLATVVGSAALATLAVAIVDSLKPQKRRR
ncbi:MAG TPA: hypothetical protein VKX49_03170 [Bryobacteraceae bacterium]|nr:hypothetical protein [Bryobacteraceae bacterium]